MILKDKLKMFSELKIEIGTKFSDIIEKSEIYEEDMTKEVEKSFHHACIETIEEYLIEYGDEDFNERVLDKMSEKGYSDFLEDISDFSDFGSISMELSKIKEAVIKDALSEVSECVRKNDG